MTNYITKTIKNGVEANIPVTSVNWQYGDVTVASGITKIFTLSSDSDLTNAQAAYDRYVSGGNPIIEYWGKISGGRYVLVSKSATQLEFALLRPQNWSTTQWVYIRAAKIRLIASSSVVTTIYSSMISISISSTAPTVDNKENITLVI